MTEKEFAEVVKASSEGAKIECRVDGGVWVSKCHKGWDFTRFEYRVALAPGYNPEQVPSNKVPEGWRCLSEEEQTYLLSLGNKCPREFAFWDNVNEPNSVRTDELGIVDRFVVSPWTYFTDKPPGYWLPKPKIAEGHNPDNVTEEQVGVSQGWRCLSTEEVLARKGKDSTEDIEAWSKPSGAWFGYMVGNYVGLTYRTKRPPGYFLDPTPAPLTIGSLVSKVGGDYRFDGTVVSVFTKLSGQTRYVVEDDRGVLHIYSEKNLERRAE